MIIYKATNTINKKVYIGQTKNTLEFRKEQHKRETKSKRRKNTYFHNAIEKYGLENFIFETIDEVISEKAAEEREQYWIKYYNSTDYNYGYNLDTGGRNCKKADSTKRIIGDSSLQKWQNKTIAKKMLAGLRRGTKKWQEICQNRRIDFICPVCGKVIKNLPPREAQKRKTCSLKCAGKIYGAKGVAAAKEAIKERNAILKAEIKNIIVNWAKENKKVVSNCPKNRISAYLSPLLNTIYEKYDIKDFRSLFVCFNVKNKNDFLLALKNSVVEENVC